jgi:hypothetical protein
MSCSRSWKGSDYADIMACLAHRLRWFLVNNATYRHNSRGVASRSLTFGYGGNFFVFEDLTRGMLVLSSPDRIQVLERFRG